MNGCVLDYVKQYFVLVGFSKPDIQPFRFSGKLSLGQRTAVMCVVVDGEPPFKFTWLKDGKEVTHLEGVSIVAVDDFTSTLTITKLGALSNGNYSCRVSNNAGIDEKYDVLKINGKILFYYIVKCNKCITKILSSVVLSQSVILHQCHRNIFSSINLII